MATTLEVKLYNAAQANATLVSLLGSSPFRWFDMQLDPAVQNPYPAVTVQLVSCVNQYSNTARLWTSQNRVQFTIWDTKAERARQVEMALLAFLDTFNAYNSGDQSPIQRNQVVMRRQSGNPQPEPLIFWRIVDAMIWHNETL